MRLLTQTGEQHRTDGQTGDGRYTYLKIDEHPEWRDSLEAVSAGCRTRSTTMCSSGSDHLSGGSSSVLSPTLTPWPPATEPEWVVVAGVSAVAGVSGDGGASVVVVVVDCVVGAVAGCDADAVVPTEDVAEHRDSDDLLIHYMYCKREENRYQSMHYGGIKPRNT